MNEITISELIYPLDQFGKMGKIHSDFQQSFNIKIKNQLIHVGSYGEYLSSFGMYIPIDQYRQLRPFIHIGNVVKIEKERLTIYSTADIYSIDIFNPTITSLKIGPIESNKDILIYLLEILEGRNLSGLIGLPLTEEAKEIIRQLTYQVTDQVNWSQIITYLVGRGKGLTPSGDDILVAYLTALKFFDVERAEALSFALSHHRLSTTDVSLAYLKACMEGYVSSPIHELYLAIKDNASDEQLKDKMERVMYIGHTSGKDMAFGFYLALKWILHN